MTTGAEVPWMAPAPAAQASTATSAPQSGNLNAGSLLVLSILGAGIVLWVQGRHRAHEEEQVAKHAENELDEAHFALEGAREDAQLSLAEAFARRPGPLSWGP